MADKQVTVDVPEDRVPEFYLWFAAFLAAPAGSGPPRGGPMGRGRFFGHHHNAGERSPWSEDDLDDARWLYGRLSPPARELFDMLIATPGERHSGNELAATLKIEKGAHGLAGVLAWPGRWCRKLGRDFPITTTAREDGGTDYLMDAAIAELFGRARVGATPPPAGGPGGRPGSRPGPRRR